MLLSVGQALGFCSKQSSPGTMAVGIPLGVLSTESKSIKRIKNLESLENGCWLTAGL